MAFTKRNHYNPCFWTACWNLEYFQALGEGRSDSICPREQEVFVLNLQSGKIYRDRVKNVHFDKDLGIAEITEDSMKDFIKRKYPAKFEEFCRSLEKDPGPLYINFEDILTAVEGFHGYRALMDVVTACKIQDVTHKGYLTCNIIFQAMRSHEMMNSMIDTVNSIGMAKWEYFWRLKNFWSSNLTWLRATTALASSRWILHVTENHIYPLCDSPVMIRENTLMTVLSPRLLLEINLNENSPEDSWTIRKGINSSKLREFRRRSIKNSFKAIISHRREELEVWRNTREFKERSRDLNDKAKAAQLRAEAASRVIWAINGFGRLPANFESRVMTSMT